MAREIDMREIGALVRGIAEADRARAVTAMRRAAARAKTSVQQESVDVTDQGQYAASWEVREEPDGATLGNNAPHAIFIEDGRAPGKKLPPLLPILEFIARKTGGIRVHGVARNSERWDLGDQQVFKDYPELEALRQRAVAVARAIGIRGIKARRILGDSQATFERYIDEELAALTRDAAE